ncbi:MAG: PKD domain-containing protein [Candidatus Thiodiazotropha sp.]
MGALDNAGGMTEVVFAPRTVTSMRLTVEQTGFASTNIGLAEIEVYGTRDDGVNLRPTADAGPDQSVLEGDLVNLDGSASSDPNGDPINYQWAQVSGIPVTLSGSTTESPSIIAPSGLTQSEVLMFELVVDDAIDSSLPDTVNITVISLQNINVAPIASVTASSQNRSTSQIADKAVDTVPSGYPNDHTREWATTGEGAGAWIELAWSSAQTVDRILLYDRPNGSDQIVSGATRRAGAIFPPSGVIIRSCSITTPRSFCLAGQKNSPSRADWINVNRP